MFLSNLEIEEVRSRECHISQDIELANFRVLGKRSKNKNNSTSIINYKDRNDSLSCPT